MHANQCFDFVIIGAGIAGASLAYRLAGQASVLVLERESQPGYHSTGRSAAMFMEAYGTPQIQALTRASRAFYQRPPQGFCEHPLMEPRGCLYVASEEQLDQMQQTYDETRARSANVRLITAEQARA
ncbi:FAD-dependent oxidoreductase, partial [Pseudomonas protegens]|uniref:FAD-dependent oxidoreductase n=1 Tax=Pseudomonas protegens TaxID=380021 RepID=UPI0034D787F3